MPAARPERLRGVLRAVHLDKDWLELTAGSEHLRVDAVDEEVEDVIGPLVNRPVIVYTSTVAGKRRFVDIEADHPAPAPAVEDTCPDQTPAPDDQ